MRAGIKVNVAQMMMPVLVQKYCLWNLSTYPGIEQHVYPDSVPVVMDLMTTWSWSVLKTQLVQWDIARMSHVQQCIVIVNPIVTADFDWSRSLKLVD